MCPKCQAWADPTGLARRRVPTLASGTSPREREGAVVVLVAKAARQDLLYWLPNAGIPLSLLIRLAAEVFTDSTACVHFRIPYELGGLYYTLNAALGQARRSLMPHAVLYGSASAQHRAAAM
jgi:hypothetical protein